MPIGFESDLPPVQGDGAPRPSTRPGGGPPGGGPGSGPGGGFGGFSGIRPQVFRGLQGTGDSIPILMRRMGIDMNAMPGAPGRGQVPPAMMAPGQPVSQTPAAPMGYAQGGFVPGVTGGPVQPSDTVPAALTPGEMVMNRGVMANPTIAAVLTLLNILGADVQGGSGMGGEMEGEDCPHCGGKMEPGEEPDEQGFACGGHVKGYAFGGFAGGNGTSRFMGGFGRGGAGIGGALFGGGGSTPKGGQTTQGGAQAANGYTYNNQGGVTGGYNASNPWGHFSENRGTDVYGNAVRNLGQAGQAGVFDPRGNRALLTAMQEGAQGDADALVRRQMSQADLGGMDPAQRAVAKLQALRDTGRGVQDIMAQTRASALGSADQFYKNIYGQVLGAGTGFIGADNAAEQQRMTDRANRPSALGQIGQIAGSLGGAYLGGRTPGVPRTPIYNPGGHGGLDYLPPAP